MIADPLDLLIQIDFNDRVLKAAALLKRVRRNITFSYAAEVSLGLRNSLRG